MWLFHQVPWRLISALNQDHLQVDLFGRRDGEPDRVDMVRVDDVVLGVDGAGVHVEALGGALGVVEDEVDLATDDVDADVAPRVNDDFQTVLKMDKIFFFHFKFQIEVAQEKNLEQNCPSKT